MAASTNDVIGSQNISSGELAMRAAGTVWWSDAPVWRQIGFGNRDLEESRWFLSGFEQSPRAEEDEEKPGEEKKDEDSEDEDGGDDEDLEDDGLLDDGPLVEEEEWDEDDFDDDFDDDFESDLDEEDDLEDEDDEIDEKNGDAKDDKDFDGK
ncbi:MAG TPA: hypothetical protein VFE46_17935 [Pirellulales bacterium]|nr:hypothetical protein [Pirellulales bacterium]